MKTQIKEFVQNNPELVQVKNQSPGITVLKYKKKVFYKNLWTPELCELRGTVVDDNFDIIQRPFTKIFNYGEKFAPDIKKDEKVQIVEKINGFMGAASLYNGELFVSTTGSTNSDFVDLARKYLDKIPRMHFSENMTYIFEVCDDSDQHIISEKPGLYLIGARFKSWDSPQQAITEENLDELAKVIGVLRPKHYTCDRFSDVKNIVKRVKHEGFMVRTTDGRELKIKSPYYLVTKFFGRKTQERLERLFNNPESIKQIIDEEYYPVIDYIYLNKELYYNMSEQEKKKYIRDFIESEILK